LSPSFDNGGKMGLVLLERGAHRLHLARQAGTVVPGNLPTQPVDIRNDGLPDLDLIVGLPGIAAKQEVLFGSPRLQQFDFDLSSVRKIARAFSADSR